MQQNPDVLDYLPRSLPLVYYYEKRFDGVRTFEIAEGRLHIKGSRLFSAHSLSIDLSTVSTAYSAMRVRHSMFYVGLFLLGTMIIAAIFADQPIVMSGGIAVGLAITATSVRKQTVYRFQYETGEAAFDIWRAGPQKARVEDFVNTVIVAVHAATRSGRENDTGTQIDTGRK